MQEVVKTSVKRKQNSKRQRRRRRNMSMYILCPVHDDVFQYQVHPGHR